MAAITTGVVAGIGAFSSISNAYAQSQAIKAQAAYQSTIAKLNADLANMNAEDAIERGDIAARDYQGEVNKMIGSQRVAYAASGIDVDFGSAAAVQEETRIQGALDAITIKNNAWKEAWGYKMDALNQTYRGEFVRREASGASRMTMLTGGLQALSYGVKAAGGLNTGSRNSGYKLQDGEEFV